MVKAGKFAVRLVRAGRRALTGRRSGLSARGLSASASQALLIGGLFAAAVPALTIAVPAFAQGWWPFGGNQQEERGPPVPREPVYREPPPGGAVPPPAQGGWASQNKNPICLELEQRLVQEGQRGNESRSMLPMIENEIRRVDQEYRGAQQQLDRDCYEYFLFSKTLRKTRRCVDLANQADEHRRRLADLETQQQQLSSGRSYQDDIVRELARNRCGPAYEQQARRHDRDDDSSMWNDEESSGGGGMGSFGSLPYATYRTVCVRLCDGYYFPVSFSTLPNHFERDAEACSSKCAAPAELYYYQNPGGSVDQMVAARSNEQYTQLKTAFRYRKEYVQGCSCKISEYVPEAGSPQQQGAAQPGAAGQASAGAAGQGSAGAQGFLATAPDQSAGQAQRAESGSQPLPWEQR